MRTGKVKQLLRMLSEKSCKSPLPITPVTRQVLIDKHPEAKPTPEATKLKGPIRLTDPCIFEQINGMLIWIKAVNNIGTAGPSGLNAKYFKTFISKKLSGGNYH